jgi:hypothetical protein
MDTGVVSSGLNQPAREGNHSSPSGSEAKNNGAILLPWVSLIAERSLLIISENKT